MATTGSKVTTPLPLISEPTESVPQVSNDNSTPAPAAVQPDIVPDNGPVLKLSPEKRAKINAKYEAKHIKNNEKHRKACERLAMESDGQASSVCKRQDKLDKKAKRRGDRINAKHSRKVDRAEKRACKKAEKDMLK